MLRALASITGNYLRLILFALALLVGVQIPGILGQYKSVVSAHLSEAKQNVLGFQDTAARYFNNDINKLIAHYRQSQDPVFNSDAKNIQAIVDRVSMLNAELFSIQQSPILAAMHVSTQFDKPLFKEALHDYKWAVPLNIAALIWGFCFALLVVLLLDACILGVARLFSVRPNKPSVV